MDYNARWYSSSLGRFTQPDTIIPNPMYPQSLNRFSYTYNNPLNLNDPTGHEPGEPDSYRDQLAKFQRNRLKKRFGITLTRDAGAAEWTFREISSAYFAAKLVDRMLRRFTAKQYAEIEAAETGDSAFSDVFGTFNNPLTINKRNVPGKDSYCHTHQSGNQIDCWSNARISIPLLIHEMGHVFDYRHNEVPATDWGRYNQASHGWVEHPNGLREAIPGVEGSGRFIYYFNLAGDDTNGENFADMFLALTMNWWAVDETTGVLTAAAQRRQNFMLLGMPYWISGGFIPDHELEDL